MKHDKPEEKKKKGKKKKKKKMSSLNKPAHRYNSRFFLRAGGVTWRCPASNHCPRGRSEETGEADRPPAEGIGRGAKAAGDRLSWCARPMLFLWGFYPTRVLYSTKQAPEQRLRRTRS